MMLEALVMSRNERFRSDNTGIRKISVAVAQSAGLGYFNTPLLFPYQLPGIDDLTRTVDGTGFIHVIPIAPDPLLLVACIEFLKTEIGGEEIVLVIGLYMISDGNPTVILRFFYYTRPQWIQVDVNEAVYKCCSCFYDDAFETFRPEKASPVVVTVVITGKVNFNILNKLRKACQLVPYKSMSIALIKISRHWQSGIVTGLRFE